MVLKFCLLNEVDMNCSINIFISKAPMFHTDLKKNFPSSKMLSYEIKIVFTFYFHYHNFTQFFLLHGSLETNFKEFFIIQNSN